ncbi:MAG: hypothetical protein EWV85_06770 [Microcystis aeruginosa Ma_QC_C_20070703_M131]|uniref:Uncharacterized protein n=2 Tax=Microcystis aeruginosa TaxID=1126 RepID=A0A551Y907_MICAE|nr:MAG: hypothetical protein EWV85_06770 [Microcystis aeruginosa Ma_QC_C_20070703_M131]
MIICLLGWSDSSTERFSGWDIIPTQVPWLNLLTKTLCHLKVLSYSLLIMAIFDAYHRDFTLLCHPVSHIVHRTMPDEPFSVNLGESLVQMLAAPALPTLHTLLNRI